MGSIKYGGLAAMVSVSALSLLALVALSVRSAPIHVSACPVWLSARLAGAGLGCALARPVPAQAAEGPAWPDVTGALRQRLEQLQRRWLAQVRAMRESCQHVGAADLVAELDQWLQEPTDDLIRFRVPSTFGAPADKRPGLLCEPNGGTSQGPLRAAWQRLRRQHARELFELASEAFRAGRIALCYELLWQVIELDPEHGRTRALLGFTRHGDRWVSPYTANKLRAGYVWHRHFGWIPKGSERRYEAGEQLWRGRWLPAEEVNRLRSNWSHAWQIETQHYLVRTNTSLERGVEFAERLERFYLAFYRLFAGCFARDGELAALFGGGDRRTAVGTLRRPERTERFRVHFFRTREEYLREAGKHVRMELAGTVGIYVPRARIAYFFADRKMETATLYHEATHQLFCETRRTAADLLSASNYWVVEGLPCYMLGRWDCPRLQVGRLRILAGDYVPLEQFGGLRMSEFGGRRIQSLYSQAACLCRFLMHYRNGVYRDAFLRYVDAVYSGSANAATLSELLGTDYDSLQQQFLEHVRDAPAN